ncbi:centromere protein P [Callorhinchus milii]|uniref:centromere protein P n=1 Tax=Callorhinchus milii TaxID=7868 RepID=UPI001C3F5DD8|nr:centromere protein P [Callorhinchus milii]
MFQAYEDEIHSLEEEIKMLEEQSQDSQQDNVLNSGENLKTAELHRENLTSLNPELWKCSSTDVENQIKETECQIAFLSQLTGICFSKYDMQTVEKDNNKVMQCRLFGNSRSVHFELEFEMMENKIEGNVAAIITELNIILESNEFYDLSRFISRAEEQKSLLLFFRTLSVFTKWYDCRQSTFRHFKDKYPETVRLPERGSGECLVLQCPSLTGFELRIFWKILVSDDGLVTPVLDLLTKIPEQALNLDVNKVVENAGSSFRTLLRLFGIEGAIESLIKALCTKD